MKKHISKYQRNSSGDTQNLTAKHDTEQAGAVLSYLPLNTVTYNRDLVSLGGINCAIYLSTILYNFSEWSKNDGGWMLLNVDLIQRITGLTPEEQCDARITLRNQGVIRDGMAFDVPAISVDLSKVNEFLDKVVTNDYN